MRTKNLSRRWRGPALGGALLCVAILGLSMSNASVEASELGGSDRYLAHLATDKPIYRAGETLYLRTTLLHAFNRTPLAGRDTGHLKITSPRDETVAQMTFRIDDSTGGASWVIPEGTPGGEYTATVSFPNSGHAPAERKFEIRAYHTPRIRSQVEFLRKAYGPGDTVSAILSATRAEGGIPEFAQVTAVARIDGAEVWRGVTRIDENGNCAVSFDLPEEIKEGVGSLTLVIEDGGVIESASRTLPILLQRIPMNFYAEGGELVAGLESGLYVEARTPWGDPADLKAEIVDADGAKVAEFATEHEGRGRVSFTPEAGAKYFARVIEPTGITELVALPEVIEHGATLRADKPSYGMRENVGFHVAATKAGEYRLSLFQREVEVGSAYVNLKAGESRHLSLTPASTLDGVLRATLFDADDTPLAERLVFRKPNKQVNIEIIATPQDAVPGEKIELTVRTTNDKGEPISAVVGLTVTDDSMLEMIQTRRQAPRLPVMVLLENEVDRLEDAHFYLGDDPMAETAIDLLLGTQGWRRFAYMDAKEFMEKHGDDAKRAFAFRDMEAVRRYALQNRWAESGVARGGRLGRDGGPAAAPDREDAAPPSPPSVGRNEQEAARAEDVTPTTRVVDRARDRNLAEELDMDEALRVRALGRAPVAVREYAHQVREDRQPGDRRDFTETLYWNAGVKTDAETGEAGVSFYLSDSVTSFRVMADAFTSTGVLGQADALITSREPFYIEPRLPLEVTAGDEILLPVSVVNSTSGGLMAVVEAEVGAGLSLPANFVDGVELRADERGRLLLPVTVGQANGRVTLTVSGQAGSFSDRVTRQINVRPLGFPVSYNVGGVLENPQAFNIVIPEDVAPNSVRTETRIYPSPAANLMQAMEALIRAPYG